MKVFCLESTKQVCSSTKVDGGTTTVQHEGACAVYSRLKRIFFIWIQIQSKVGWWSWH